MLDLENVVLGLESKDGGPDGRILPKHMVVGWGEVGTGFLLRYLSPARKEEMVR